MSKVEKGDLVPSQGRPGMARRYLDAPRCELCGNSHWAECPSGVHMIGTHGAAELDEDAAKLVAMGQDPGPTLEDIGLGRPSKKVEAARAAIDAVAEAKKMGRPKRADKPWVAEGISKSLWYRRDKERRMAGSE